MRERHIKRMRSMDKKLRERAVKKLTERIGENMDNEDFVIVAAVADGDGIATFVVDGEEEKALKLWDELKRVYDNEKAGI